MSVIDFLFYVGIFVFAISGALKARAHKMDIFGASVIAFTISYGGGTIRDLFIGRPIIWINDYLALGLVSGAVILTFLFKSKNFSRTIFITDAIGIGLYTLAGIDRSLSSGINEVYSIIMGVITATFGGLLADIISNEVPSLLKRGELYATASAIGGAIYVVLLHVNPDKNINIFICIIVTMIIRIVSIRRKLMLPNI